MSDMRENFAYSAIFTFILAFVLALILASIYAYTKPLVALNQEKELAVATLRALDVPPTDNPVAVFEEKFGKEPSESQKLEEITLDGQSVKVLQFSGRGLWDYINGVLAVKGDLSEIIGLAITEQKETPGLGGRISEPSFQEQFRGEQIDGKIAMRTSTGGAYSSDRSDSSFDAVSGATLTSVAFAQIVNDAVNELRNK